MGIGVMEQFQLVKTLMCMHHHYPAYCSHALGEVPVHCVSQDYLVIAQVVKLYGHKQLIHHRKLHLVAV